MTSTSKSISVAAPTTNTTKPLADKGASLNIVDKVELNKNASVITDQSENNFLRTSSEKETDGEDLERYVENENINIVENDETAREQNLDEIKEIPDAEGDIDGSKEEENDSKEDEQPEEGEPEEA